MKKILISFATLLILFGGVITNSYALTTDAVVEPRAQVFEQTLSKKMTIVSPGGSYLGEINLSCTATIKYINGTFTIDSYKFTGVDKKFGTTRVIANVQSSSRSGMKITAKWKIEVKHATIPPTIVTSQPTYIYDFS